MNKKLQLKKLVTDYAIYNVERSMTRSTALSFDTKRNRAELERLNIKCEDILRELTSIIDEL